MKKLLIALITSLPLLAHCPKKSYEPPRTSYVAVGANIFYYIYPIPFGLEISGGERLYYGRHHVWDRQVGLGIGLFGQTLYFQNSYLHYFRQGATPYLGVGVTLAVIHSHAGFLRPYANIPFTIGYQYEGGNFLQLQVTPIMTFTVTYGVKLY